jgi:pumilio RNA-binding family
MDDRAEQRNNLQHFVSNQMLNEIVAHTQDLVHDQYGNYVVQHVLEHGQPKERNGVLERLR